LPHLPSLKIREGAIDALVYLYRKIIIELDGYMTEDGSIVLSRAEKLFVKLGQLEDEIFRRDMVFKSRFKPREEKKNPLLEEYMKIKPKKDPIEVLNNEEINLNEDDLLELENFIDDLDKNKKASNYSEGNKDDFKEKFNTDVNKTFKTVLSEMIKVNN
jgi:5'-3' exonuclease